MAFNANKVTTDLITWLQQTFAISGPGCNAVLGISGGKDSTVAAALCAKALGKERVIGVLLPNGIQNDIQDSRAVVEHLGIKSYELNIKNPFDAILQQLAIHTTPSEQTRINLAPRLRMAVIYAISQSFNGRVINTSNLSEAWVGYSTRYGDSAGDFAPLLHLTASEVKAIGHTLNLPNYLVEKTPSDGLSGKSDEDKLGFTYQALDTYIRTGVCPDETVKARIDTLHKANRFKQLPMPSFEYTSK